MQKIYLSIFLAVCVASIAVPSSFAEENNKGCLEPKIKSSEEQGDNKGYIEHKTRGSANKTTKDEQIVALLNNMYTYETKGYDEKIARRLILTKYIRTLQRRKTKYIRESGIFDITYKKVDLKKWLDTDLLLVYNRLNEKIKDSADDQNDELTEDEKIQKSIIVLGSNMISKELKKRNSKGFFVFLPVAEVGDIGGASLVVLQGLDVGD